MSRAGGADGPPSRPPAGGNVVVATRSSAWVPGRALSIRLSSDIGYLLPRVGVHPRAGHDRHAKSDLRVAPSFARAALSGSVALVSATGAVTAWASRRMSWDTWAWRLLVKNGTPRFS